LKSIRLAPEAARELHDAAIWYESRQAGLANRFLDELDALLPRIRQNPAAFPCLAEFPEDLEIRRALMVRFPYSLVFLDLQDHIRIVAVAHGKRRPGYWLYRLRSKP
jgi:plasmid stabilization system protein ParE